MARTLMKIELDSVGKRYKTEWIIRGLSLEVAPGQRYAITGPNGSGKSTLMKMLSGFLSPSKGQVSFSLDGRQLGVHEVYRHLSFAAPYIELIEELTLTEAIRFHRQFKATKPGMDDEAIYQLLGFRKARSKQVRNFSSGMKQRLRLALALVTESPLLLLDEPTTNLDEEGIGWYRGLIARFGTGRTLVIASNAAVDFDFCEHKVYIPDYKQ